MTISSLKQHGYLMIDHRFSPGLPEDVALKTGLDPKYTGEGKLYEADTLTCSHCKTVVIKNPDRVRDRNNCPKCNFHYVCDACAAAMREPGYSHMPFEAIIERNMALGSPPRLLLPDEPV